MEGIDPHIYNINDPCGGAIILSPDATQCILVETHKGYFSHPKGKINKKSTKNKIKDSHFIAGCFREIKEETGREPHDLTIITVSPLIELSDKGNPSIQYLVTTTPQIPYEKFEFDPKELKSVKWYPVEMALKLPNLKLIRRSLLQKAIQIVHDSTLSRVKGDSFLNLFKSETRDPVSKTRDPVSETMDPVSETMGQKQKTRDSVSETIKMSKNLSKVLRHRAQQLGLNMDSGGYVKLKDLLKLSMFDRVTVSQIELVVANNDKQRFHLKKVGHDYWIRANQAHNKSMSSIIKTDQLYQEEIKEPLDVCIHGTNQEFIGSILKSGLQQRERLGIHMIPNEPNHQEIVSGLKQRSNVLIYINMALAMQDGIKFFRSTNNVILTQGFQGVIDPKYFQKIKYL